MSGFLDGIGAVLGKITNWIPNRRESMQNNIDKIKKEMEDVINKKPFDALRYSNLADRLLKLERQERRAS